MGVVGATAKASASSSMQEDQAGGVAKGDQILKELRAKCPSSLCVAAAILAKPDVQDKALLVLVLCRPGYSPQPAHQWISQSPEAASAGTQSGRGHH